MQMTLSRLKLGGLASQLVAGSKILIYGRWQWWPVAITSFLVGSFVVGNSLELNTVFILSLIFVSLPYHLLRFGLSDVFDFISHQQTDRQVDAPRLAVSERSLSGVIFWIVFTNVAILVPLMLQAPPAARLWLIALVVAAIGYSVPTVRFKETPFFDIVSFACFVAGPLVLAQLTMGADPLALESLIAFFLWGGATYLFGSIQDIDLDRLGWTRSTARTFGHRGAVIAATVLYLGAAAVAYFGLEGSARWLTALPVAFALNTVRFIGVTNPDLYGLGWRITLRLTSLSSLTILAFLADTLYRG